MLKRNTSWHLVLLMSFLLLSLSACSLSMDNKLAWLDTKVGEGLDQIAEDYDIASSTSEDINDEDVQEKKEQVEELTGDMKNKIDTWIEENDLNRYGDSIKAVYTGGTPLFNEVTGETIDRYKYILKNHSYLQDLLKNK